MRNLVTFGIVVFGVMNCGGEFDGKSSSKKAVVEQRSQTTCDINGQNCKTTVITTDDGGGKDPGQSGPIYTGPYTGPVVYTDGTYGAGIPASYTMIDTPNANLCVDAFNRMGIDLPATTVARSFNSFNVRNNGIAWQDMGASAIPVMNILNLSSTFSNVTFQMLNPVGFYCIVRNDATFSNVTMQKRCSAQIAQIEPMTVVTVKEPVSHGCGWFGWFCGSADNMSGTTNSYNSEIREVPCIP